MSTTSEELLNAIKSYATGVLKGNTADTLGAPVDIINEAVIRPIATALGMEKKVSKEPVGGSKSLRKMMGMSAEDSNIAETIGSLLSVGGAAKAIIVPAFLTKSLKEVRGAEKSTKDIEDLYRETGIYRLPTQVDDGILRSVISDENAVLRRGSAVELTNSGFTIPPGSLSRVSDVLDHPELFAKIPQLADLRIGGMPDSPKDSAVFRPSDNYIGLGTFETKQDITSAILHEIQHGTQYLYGMKGGASPEAFMKDPKKFKQAQDNLRQKDYFLQDLRDSPFIDAAEKRRLDSQIEAVQVDRSMLAKADKDAKTAYALTAGEAEARAVETLYVRAKDGRNTPNSPLNYYDVPPRKLITGPKYSPKVDDDFLIQTIIQSALK